MRYQTLKLFCLLGTAGLLLVNNQRAQAQAAGSVKYNHPDVFRPITWQTPGSERRSPGGFPGEHYWQNRADYQIRATLAEAAQDTTITGEVTVLYTHNRPDKLDYLWQ